MFTLPLYTGFLYEHTTTYMYILYQLEHSSIRTFAQNSFNSEFVHTDTSIVGWFQAYLENTFTLYQSVHRSINCICTINHYNPKMFGKHVYYLVK